MAGTWYGLKYISGIRHERFVRDENLQPREQAMRPRFERNPSKKNATRGLLLH